MKENEMEWSREVVEIGDQIFSLTPVKANELLTYLKEVYNIEPINVPQPKKEEKQVEKVIEQTEFTVVLESFDQSKKIPLVKSYREITGLNIKDAMAAINACPTKVKENIPKLEAEKIKSSLEEYGGKVVLK